MANIWAFHIGPSGQPGPSYWDYFGARLIDLATIPKGAAILDIGTGGGSVLFPAAEKADDGHAFGIDIASDWLREITTVTIKERCLTNVAVAQMDAARLGFQAATFDLVLSGFIGWDYCFDFERMVFTRPDTRIGEISRALKPGGQVGISSWVEQSDIEWLATAFQRHLPEYVAELEKTTKSRMALYSQETPEGFKKIMLSGGFRDIEICVETETFTTPDEETWWKQMDHAAWRDHFEALASAGLDRLQQFKEHVFEDLQEFKRPEGICFSKTVLLAFGIK